MPKLVSTSKLFAIDMGLLDCNEACDLVIECGQTDYSWKATMLSIAIAGAAGRMGKTLVEAVAGQSDTLQLSQASVLAGDPSLGLDAGLLAIGRPLQVLIQATLDANAFDILIDFTTPEASIENLAACQMAGKAIVIGTTGFDQSQLALIERAAESIAIVMAPNYSVGVNLSFKLLEMAAKVLGDDYDVEVFEAHHRHKKDAPSGTALKMGQVVAASLDRNLEEVAVYGREGIGEERDSQTIGFATVRAGDIVGDHTVTFAGGGERLEITHKASNRMTFASGAIRAAAWVASQPPGLYSMQDVLGLS